MLVVEIGSVAAGADAARCINFDEVDFLGDSSLGGVADGLLQEKQDARLPAWVASSTNTDPSHKAGRYLSKISSMTVSSKGWPGR